MSQYKKQERIALEARLNAELRQSRFATRLKNVDDGTPEDTQTLVNQMLDWEKHLGLEIGTVETLIYAYGEDAYQIMHRAQHDTNVFLATMPTRLRITVNTQNPTSDIIRAFRDTRLTNTEKISCLSNSHKHKLDKNIANNIINQKRNEQKAQYRLLDTASLEELIAVQAYDRAVQYCKDHKLDITDANLTRTDLLPNINSPNRPQLTSNQLNLAKEARRKADISKYGLPANISEKDLESVRAYKTAYAKACKAYNTSNPTDQQLIKQGAKAAQITAAKAILDKSDAHNTYVRICYGKPKDYITIEELLAAGVTAEDIQALADKEPTLAYNIKDGPTMSKIAEAAFTFAKNNPGAKALGNCGTGLRNNVASKVGGIYQSALASQATYLPSGIGSGGCTYWRRLEQSGQFITITRPNTAYVPEDKLTSADKRNLEQIKIMNNYTDLLPAGVTICWDNQIVNGKPRSTNLPGAKNNHAGGLQDGHTGAKASPPGTPSIHVNDGIQHNPHYAGWYGKYMHISYPIDALVSAEWAEKLIQQAQERTHQCLDVASNQKAYQNASVKKDRTMSPKPYLTKSPTSTVKYVSSEQANQTPIPQEPQNQTPVPQSNHSSGTKPKSSSTHISTAHATKQRRR